MKAYVTFRIKSTPLAESLGYHTKCFAIECKDEEEALYVASEVYGMDGVSHLYLNRKGKLNPKAKVIKYGPGYEAEIN